MTEAGHAGDAASSQAPRRRRRPEPTPTQRALGLLTRREHSGQELTRKLVSRGVEAGDAQAAIDKLVAAGWQDDSRFAASVVRSSLRLCGTSSSTERAMVPASVG